MSAPAQTQTVPLNGNESRVCRACCWFLLSMQCRKDAGFYGHTAISFRLRTRRMMHHLRSSRRNCIGYPNPTRQLTDEAGNQRASSKYSPHVLQGLPHRAYAPKHEPYVETLSKCLPGAVSTKDDKPGSQLFRELLSKSRGANTEHPTSPIPRCLPSAILILGRRLST